MARASTGQLWAFERGAAPMLLHWIVSLLVDGCIRRARVPVHKLILCFVTGSDFASFCLPQRQTPRHQALKGPRTIKAGISSSPSPLSFSEAVHFSCTSGAQIYAGSSVLCSSSFGTIASPLLLGPIPPWLEAPAMVPAYPRLICCARLRRSC